MKGRVTFSPTTFCLASLSADAPSRGVPAQQLFGAARQSTRRFDVQGIAGDLPNSYLADALQIFSNALLPGVGLVASFYVVLPLLPS